MQPFIPWSSSVSVFVIEMMAIIHSLKCTVPFSFAVPLPSLGVTNCHSLSLGVTLCHSLYHSLSFVVIFCTTRCHSLSYVVTRCTTRLSFYKRSIMSISKSTHVKLDNIFWKLHVFKINIFSLPQFNFYFLEKSYIKQAQMFYQNYSSEHSHKK